MEMKATDNSTKLFEVGKYPNAAGLREYPYSTNMATNPYTYKSLGNSDWNLELHVVGAIWATVLYEVYWSLVNKLGFQEDIYSADITKGNTLMLQIVVDGMKYNHQLTGGRYACDIWRGFAKRGLGTEAEMSADKKRTESTELPGKCAT
ncbi:Fungalysin metallopeptidase-domain-containing protein [Syncephalis fuscata]|nr:Fungalysin metallopeptidase-domain-containing protein [Syncephalis fuscata]